jgi:hypothetical protein
MSLLPWNLSDQPVLILYGDLNYQNEVNNNKIMFI